MKILIENYRGFDIHFDTDEEIFCIFSDTYDNQNTKKSFSAAKKYIDDYIKDNIGFKPIIIISKLSSYEVGKIITLTGIRKDGRFSYEENGKNKQLSDYDTGKYIIYDPINHPKIIKEYNELCLIESKAREEVRKKEAEFTGTPLSEIKKLYVS